jgi:hypothetical protein
MLVETLLEWEAWLKSDQMELKHVEAAKQKHRYIMYLIKKVGNHVKGMGLKLMKFHGIMHMYMDIIHFGVPMEFDTGTNESVLSIYWNIHWEKSPRNPDGNGGVPAWQEF